MLCDDVRQLTPYYVTSHYMNDLPGGDVYTRAFELHTIGCIECDKAVRTKRWSALRSKPGPFELLSTWQWFRCYSQRTNELKAFPELVDQEASPIRIANAIVQQAIKDGAMRIEFIPRDHDEKFGVIYTISGQSRMAMELPFYIYPPLLNRFKLMAGVRLFKSSNQSGQLSMKFRDHPFDADIEFEPTHSGERVTIELDVRQVENYLATAPPDPPAVPRTSTKEELDLLEDIREEIRRHGPPHRHE